MISSFQLDLPLLSVTTSLIACVGLCPLLFLEHSRSIKPSDLAVIYLLASLSCESAEIGTKAYRDVPFSILLPTVAKVCIRFMLLVAESCGKERILRASPDRWPPEQLAGVLNRTFFWWINSILFQGSRDILTGNSLPPIDPALSSKLLRHRALQSWGQRGNFVDFLALKSSH